MKQVTRFSVLMAVILLVLCTLSACGGKKGGAQEDPADRPGTEDHESSREDDPAKDTVLPEDDLEAQETNRKEDASNTAGSGTKQDGGQSGASSNASGGSNAGNGSGSGGSSHAGGASDPGEDSAERDPIVLPEIPLG